jgi:hypothetical protein
MSLHGSLNQVTTATSNTLSNTLLTSPYHSISSTVVKYGGVIPPLPHMSSWRGVQLINHRENFALYLSFKAAYVNGVTEKYR